MRTDMGMMDRQCMDLVDAYLENLRRTGDSPDQTICDRRAILERLDRDMKYGLGQVTPDELAAWLYRSDLSQNSKATYYRCLKSFYGFAFNPADPWLDGANPMATLPAVRTADSVPRAATDEQVREILTRAAEPWRTFAVLAAYQGLRSVEISRLDRQHVTERELFVVRGKGGRPRAHDTDPCVWEAVKDLRSGPVARRTDTGERATAHYVSVYTRDYFHRKLKVATSLHCLRHWYGTTIQREFKDVRVTQSMLGHRQLSSTMIYTQSTDAQQRAARATLPRFAG